MHKAPFCTETNSRENRFFAATHPLDDKKGTHNVKNSTKNITFTPIHNRPLSTQIAPKNKPFAGLAKRASPRCVAITPITSAAKRRTNQTYLPLIIHQWGRTRPTPSGGQSSLKLTK